MLTDSHITIGAAAFEQPPIAFFCSQCCPGDIILKAQDWANTRGPISAPVTGGFHTPVERDVLRILLRGQAPVIIVLARAIQGYRMSLAIKAAVATSTARIVSPFPATQTRTTAATAAARNRHILTLSQIIVFAHAAPGGKTEALAREAIASGCAIFTLSSPANSNLLDLGVKVLPQ